MASSYMYPSNPKTVITYAADMLLYFNGSDDTFACSALNGRVNFTDDVINCNIDLSVDGAPGSASITIATPRHSSQNYQRFGKSVFQEMQEVEIYLKGRYLNKDSRPVYYPAFWGVLTGVNESHSGGQTTITLTCADILYWWAVTTVNLSPSAFDIPWDSSVNLTPYASKFNHMSPHQIILALAHKTTGTLLTPQNFAKYGEGDSAISRAIFQEELRNATEYWQLRQMAIGRRLRIFGPVSENENGGIKGMVLPLTEEAIQAGISEVEKVLKLSDEGDNKKGGDDASTQGSSTENKSSKPMHLDDSLFSQFHAYNTAGQTGDFLTTDSTNRLDLANQVKEFIGYEFYMDTTGEVIFKPPFYNLDVRPNDPVSILRGKDIISENLTRSVEGLVTRLEVTGNISDFHSGGNSLTLPFGAYTDYRMAKQYGVRSQSVTRKFLYDSKLCTLYAISELSRMNAKITSGSFEIIGRPELRLGFPIYVEDRDSFYYIRGLSHSYTAQGRLTTTVTVEGRRAKYLPPEDITVSGEEGKQKVRRVFTAQEGRSFDYSDPFRPRLKGVANVVQIMDLPKSYEELSVLMGKGASATAIADVTKLVVDARKLIASGTLNVDASTLSEDDLSKIIGINKGMMPNGAYQALFRKVAEGAVGIEFQTYGRPTEIIQKGVYTANLRQIPVSDEYGYELIGGFGYGRGVKLTQEGTLEIYLKAPKKQEINVKTTAITEDKDNATKTDKPASSPAKSKADEKKNLPNPQSDSPQLTETNEGDPTPPASTSQETPTETTTASESVNASEKATTATPSVKTSADAQEAKKADVTTKKDKKESAKWMYYIDPHEYQSNVTPGHAFDEATFSLENRALTPEIGKNSRSFGIGKYLTDFYDMSSIYDSDYIKCRQAELQTFNTVDHVASKLKYQFSEKTRQVIANATIDDTLFGESVVAGIDSATTEFLADEGDPESGAGGTNYAAGGGGYQWPTIPKGTVTSGYGMRNHPIKGGRKMHTGIDIAAGQQKVVAVESGTVLAASWRGGYGSTIQLQHADGVTSFYAHLQTNSVKVKKGDTVARGDHIATSNSTGGSTGHHLHFEIGPGTHANPMAYLNPNAVGNTTAAKPVAKETPAARENRKPPTQPAARKPANPGDSQAISNRSSIQA